MLDKILAKNGRDRHALLTAHLDLNLEDVNHYALSRKMFLNISDLSYDVSPSLRRRLNVDYEI